MSPVAAPAGPHRTARSLVQQHADDPAWLDAFVEAFERQRGGMALGRIMRVWGLSQSGAGLLFGVSRQAVAKWLRAGVPVGRVVAVADLAAASDLLVRYLKRDRIHAVVRRPAPALGDCSLLDLVGEGDTRAVLEATRAMFSFGDAHA